MEEKEPTMTLTGEAAKLFANLAQARDQIDAQLQALLVGAGFTGTKYGAKIENGAVHLYEES